MIKILKAMLLITKSRKKLLGFFLNVGGKILERVLNIGSLPSLATVEQKMYTYMESFGRIKKLIIFVRNGTMDLFGIVLKTTVTLTKKLLIILLSIVLSMISIILVILLSFCVVRVLVEVISKGMIISSIYLKGLIPFPII